MDTFSNEAKVTAVNRALLINLSNEEKQDITSKVKADGSLIKVDFGSEVANMKWTSYIIAFELSGSNNQVSTINKFFQVKTEIFEHCAISVAQTQGWDYPEKYDYNDEFPVTFKALSADEYPIVHI